MLVHSALAWTLMRIAYGIEVTEPDDKYFRMAKGIALTTESVTAPGRFLVEAAPVLRYLPAWFPGGEYKRYAANAKTFVETSSDGLFKAAMEGLVSNYP